METQKEKNYSFRGFVVILKVAYSTMQERFARVFVKSEGGNTNTDLHAQPKWDKV